MSFTPSIPASSQTLGNSRAQILNNFAILRSTIAVNHIDVNDSGNGKHRWCHLVSRTTTNPSTSATENCLFTRLAANSTERLFFRKPSNGVVVQLSNTDPIVSNSGASFLMGNVTDGGVMIQWGSGTTAANGTLTVNFPHAFRNTSDVGTAPWSIQATIKEDAGTTNTGICVHSISSSGSGCKITVVPSDQWDVSWIAIGPRT